MRKRTSREAVPARSEGAVARGTAEFYYNGDVPRPSPKVPRPLPRSFYDRNTLTVARELLGSVLARRMEGGEILKGRIVEVEAYVGEEDQACHARAGRTRRTDPLYGPPGFAYVYLTYGMHYLLNAVAEPEGKPAAVLIRAVEPVQGIEWMMRGRAARSRRENGRERAPSRDGFPVHDLASGPAKLCQAFGLDLAQNRSDLLGPEIWIEAGAPTPDARVQTSARIGCERARAPWDLIPWRFFESDSPFVTPGRSPGRNGDSGVRARKNSV